MHWASHCSSQRRRQGVFPTLPTGAVQRKRRNRDSLFNMIWITISKHVISVPLTGPSCVYLCRWPSSAMSSPGTNERVGGCGRAEDTVRRLDRKGFVVSQSKENLFRELLYKLHSVSFFSRTMSRCKVLHVFHVHSYNGSTLIATF
jgi:hypothetical protein